MVVDVGFRGCVGPGLAPFQLQLPDHWSCFGIDTQASGLSAGFGQFLFQFRLLAGGILRQRRLHLRQQIVFEECLNLGQLQVHDPVQAEIEIAAVELEHRSQQVFQPLEFFGGLRRRLLLFRLRSECCRVAHDGALHSSRTLSLFRRVRQDSRFSCWSLPTIRPGAIPFSLAN